MVAIDLVEIEEQYVQHAPPHQALVFSGASQRRSLVHGSPLLWFGECQDC